MTTLQRTLLRAAMLAATTVAALAPASAHAGTYSYEADPCQTWQPGPTDGSRIAEYAQCPIVTVRNVVGNFSTPNGVNGGWATTVPAPGTVFTGARLSGTMFGGASWNSYIGTNQAIVDTCAAGCSRTGALFAGALPDATAVTIGVRCNDAGGCPNSGTDPRASVQLGGAQLSVRDDQPPAAPTITSGLTAGQWIGGTNQLTVSASDNTGIASLQPIVDDRELGSQSTQLDCSSRRPLPCPQAANERVPVNLSGVEAGEHRLAIKATDTGGATSASPPVAVKVDNTAPASPVALSLADGATAWRSTNAYSLSWTNPVQQGAPVVRARYLACPTSSPPDSASCVSSIVDGDNVSRIDSLTLPGAGAWTVAVWLVDAAGNELRDNASTIDLGFDDTAPTVSEILPKDPRDPARVRARASDAQSGLAKASVELRRRGGRSWRPIPTRIIDDTITAVIPDRRLRRGQYELRALATNRAGLTGGSSVRAGKRARVTLPIRRAARLSATRAGTSHQRVVRSRIGRRVKLTGRLTTGGKGLRRRISVLQRPALRGARFTRVATVMTDTRGRFTYRAPAGRARTVRFIYAGGPTIADAQASVQLRVQARLRLHTDRNRVRNGEYVQLAGRLRGGTIPPDGAQLALQVYSRGSWRPFATPKTDSSGRFNYAYRFETVLGTARFKFRAVLLKSPVYAYYGTSNTVRMTVRGL